MQIALAAPTALAGHKGLSRFGQVGHEFRLRRPGRLPVLRRARQVEKLGPQRHFDAQIRRGLAVFLASLATGTVFCLVDPLEAQVVKRQQVWVGPHHHIAALAAVTAVRAAAGNEFLPPKRHASGAALARTHENLGFVHKTHASSVPLRLPCRSDIPVQTGGAVMPGATAGVKGHEGHEGLCYVLLRRLTRGSRRVSPGSRRHPRAGIVQAGTAGHTSMAGIVPADDVLEMFLPESITRKRFAAH